MKDITDTMVRFAALLRTSWYAVTPFYDEAEAWVRDHDQFMDDWIQACWELLVEPAAGELLYEYGGGSEVNDPSSRVTTPQEIAKHRVACLPRAGGTSFVNVDGDTFDVPQHGAPFDVFVARRGLREPPFNQVMMYTGLNDQQCVQLDAVRFVVRELRDDD